jgi:hypothetical protein
MVVFFHVSIPPNNFEPVEGLPRYDLSATLDTISSHWFGLSLSVATRWPIEILFQPQAKDCPLAPASRLTVSALVDCHKADLPNLCES